MMSLQQTKGQVDRLSFEVALTFTLDISFRTWNMTDIHMYYIYIYVQNHITSEMSEQKLTNITGEPQIARF